MADRTNIEVTPVKDSMDFRVRYRIPGQMFQEMTVNYETGRLILAAEEQGRKKALKKIREALGFE